MDVRTRWGLGDASIERVVSGATNKTWRVNTDGQVRFLRNYRSTDRRAVQREHDLIGQVADAGVSTPRPISAVDDETIVDVHGSLFALFEIARGQQLEPGDLDIRHAASTGRLLARIHNATAHVDVEGFREQALRWDGPAWAARVRATIALIPQDSPSDVDRWALRRSVAHAEWLDHPDCRHSYDSTAPQQIIHGDYQHANLFFEGSEATAVIDWDTAVVATRGFEIVRACSFMFNLDVERTNSFLSGYRSAAPLSAAELHDGARAWGCYADHHVWAIEERYRHGNQAAERFIPRQDFEPFERRWGSVVLDAS